MRSIPVLLASSLMAATAFAAPPPSATPSLSAINLPATQLPEISTVGTLHVRRYGDHGRPLILIPGLASGAWTWDATVKQLRDDHVVYTVTLAGFNGTPPPQKMTGLMDQANAALLKLITSRHIDHPVLVGHSLGGTLAIRFATEHSDLLSGVVAVDGLPVFPGMQDLTDAQRKGRAQAVTAQMSGMTAAQFEAQQLRYMQAIGFLDPKMAAHYAKLTARSDPAATIEYMAEDMAADFRPGLKSITVPLLEIVPFNAPDAQRMAQMRGMKKVWSAADKVDYYRQLLIGAPQLKLKSIAPSRHFVMFDQPAKFQAALAHFLARPDSRNP